MLGGHPETLTYAAGFAGCFLLDRCHRRGWGWPTTGPKLLARGALAAALGAALAAPVLLPTLTFLPTTLRAAAVEAAMGPVPLAELWHDLLRPPTLALWRWRALHRLVTIAAPNAFGDQRTAYWGETNYLQDTAGFAGTATLLLALAGLAALVPRARRLPQERLAGLALLGGLALLAQPPGFDRVAMHLPLVGMTAAHRHQRIQVVVSFCLCYLAACGLEHWRRGEVRRRTLALAGAAVLALVAGGYLGNPSPLGPLGPRDFRLHWLWWQLAALALCGSALAWRPRRAEERTANGKDGADDATRADGAPRAGSGASSARWAGWAPRATIAVIAVIAAIAGELLGFYASANPPNDRRLAFPRLPAVRFLQAHLGGDRLIGAGRALPANFATRLPSKRQPFGSVVSAMAISLLTRLV